MNFKDLRLLAVLFLGLSWALTGIAQNKKGKIKTEDFPTELSTQEETIEVSYVAWACACPNWLPTTVSNQPGYDTTDYAQDCVFLESADGKSEIPTELHKGGKGQSMRLIGNYYVDAGISRDYEQPTSEIPAYAKVFRYTSFESISTTPAASAALSFATLDELLEFGSYRSVKAHYAKAKKEVPEPLELSMLDLALKGKNFFLFNLLGRELPLSEMIAQADIQPAKIVEWASFYAENERRKEAISTFESGFQRFPSSPMLYHAMGKMYAEAKDHQWAYEAYSKAIELATEQKNPDVTAYKSDLKALKTSLGVK